jgi:hypothetical protein
MAEFGRVADVVKVAVIGNEKFNDGDSEVLLER